MTAAPIASPPLRSPPLRLVDPAEEPAGRPRFTTHLQLSPEREQWLVERAMKRMAELRREMGLEADGRVTPGGWMSHRERHQLTYDNDLDWRRGELGGVFVESNLTLGTTKRYVREMGAKVTDDLLGTTPFFGAVKRNGSTDPAAGQLAKGTEEFVQGKIDLSNLREKLTEAQQVALIRNEAVVKVRWRVHRTPFYGPATVLADRGTGEPVLTPGGLWIYEGDDFLPDPNVEGLFRLRKDPRFAMQKGKYRFLPFESLRQELVGYEGVEAGVLDYRSFLCPLRVPTVHEADINVHLYDEPMERLAETYRGFEVFDRYLARGSSETCGEQQAIESQGEQPHEAGSSVVRRVAMAEVYLRCDADEDGFEEEILLVLDRENEQALFYEYLANQMPRRPFEPIVGVESVPNRWFGVGIMHMLDDTNNYIDAQFNRYNVRDSREASITFRDPQAVKEWKAGLPTELGSDHIYDLEPGFDRDERPPIFRINLQEVSEMGLELMQKMEQAGNLQFGIISAKDASASNLNQSRTATGILNLERTSNVLTKATETHQARGIERVLWQAVELIVEHMNERELFFSKDGAILYTLNRDEVRGLEREVRLLLTRSRSSELLATNQQALQVARDYHALRRQDPAVARDLRDLYLNQLKGLEVQDADDRLPEVSDEEIEAWKQAQAQAPRRPDSDPREFINYRDAAPPVRRQMEAEAGLQPLTPEEEARYEAPGRPQPGEPGRGPVSR